MQPPPPPFFFLFFSEDRKAAHSFPFIMSSTDSLEDGSKMEGFLRKWRQNAFNAGQFETAIFVGDKLLALTSQYPVDLVSHQTFLHAMLS